MRLNRIGDSSTRRPIHVMHVLFRLQSGGTEYGVLKLVNGLDPAVVRSSVCSTTPATSVKGLLRADIELHECSRRVGNDPRLIWQLVRLFIRERPDIVHTHAWGTLVEGLIAARLARVPVVIHGEHGTLQLKPYQTLIQRLLWHRVDRLLAVSSRLAETMAESVRFPLHRINVIKNGVDLARFIGVNREAARRDLQLPPDAVAIGTAGRLVPVKNQALLLDAFARVALQNPRVRCVIAGEGPLHQDLRRRAEALGIADRVQLLGHRPDVERVYAGLDIFVLPSLSEGLSNTILEATASGVPVVATRVGGADELIDNGVNGLLVPSDAVGPLADAIERLAADADLRRRMGEAGRLRAVMQFGLERMIHDYTAAYCDLGGVTAAARPEPFVHKSAYRCLPHN